MTRYLHLLEQADQLARISAPVDPHLELATIVDLVSKGAGLGRALLFENVSGSTLPVAANLFGTQERVGWALGTTDLEGLSMSFAADLQATGETDGELALGVLTRSERWQPTIIGDADCRQLDYSRLGLHLLPPVVAWPGDGGPYVTLAQVYTRPPEGGTLNCGMYRIQCHDAHTATLRCRPGSGAARHLAAWHERAQAMPVAVALGGPPILSWAASAPLPDDIDESAFSGYLLRKRLEMSRCQTSDLLVPASAEIVIEGSIAPGETAAEGPFGNHTGGYDAESTAPVLQVRTVHARREAIYPWTLVGPPPMENLQLALASATLLLPLVKMAVPTVRALHMPSEGIFHRAALVTVDSTEERPLAELDRLLRGTSLLRGSRLLVLGAADHDPHEPAAVFWRMLNRVDWQRDLLVASSGVTIDARRQPAGTPVQCAPEIMARVLARWREYRIDRAG